CKPVCETVYREVCRTVCVPVTETCYKNVQRTVCREVCETVMKDVCKTVCVPCTTTRCVTKRVPETADVNVHVPGRLCWQEGPQYGWEFDPCTCTTVQKQCGTKKKLVHTPGHCEQRQVTRHRCVTEQVQETHYVKKTVTEKVPTQVTRTVKQVVCEKVPVTT